MNQRLRELRMSLNMRQGDFAKSICTTQGHLSDIEHGRKNLSERLVRLICYEHKVSMAWLKYGQGFMFDKLSLNDEYALVSDGLSAQDNDLIKRITMI